MNHIVCIKRNYALHFLYFYAIIKKALPQILLKGDDGMKIIPEKLSAELVERGEANMYPLYSNKDSKHSCDDQVTVAMLELSPGTRIRLHEHKTDNEVYFIISTKEFLYCGKGDL